MYEMINECWLFTRYYKREKLGWSIIIIAKSKWLVSGQTYETLASCVSNQPRDPRSTQYRRVGTADY